MEWTDQFIMVCSWPTAPADVVAGTPDPITWGTPHFAVTLVSCNIGKAFQKMKFVFNIDICGSALGGNWASSGSKASTKKNECWFYAREEPAKFEDVTSGFAVSMCSRRKL